MGIFLFLGTACALLLVGCGEGSSTPSTDPGSENAILTSIFVDSPVQGVIYTTQTLSGITNASEEFGYLAGEQVTFSIGATQLPAVLAASQVTPIDIAAGSANPAVMTTNIARLLQSLDMDGNPNNGITIPETVATSEASLDFDMGTDDFADDAAVINLVANSGSTNTMLISAEAANLHLSETLDAIKGDGSTIPEDEILLDLRDTVWIVDHNASSCPTAGNQQILRYSQTRFSGESTSYDENCEVST